MTAVRLRHAGSAAEARSAASLPLRSACVRNIADVAVLDPVGIAGERA
jgi:hypothetical protein